MILGIKHIGARIAHSGLRVASSLRKTYGGQVLHLTGQLTELYHHFLVLLSHIPPQTD